MTGPTLTDALAARGYKSRQIGFIDGRATSFADGKREIYNIKTNNFFAYFTATEAWEWLEENDG